MPLVSQHVQRLALRATRELICLGAVALVATACASPSTSRSVASLPGSVGRTHSTAALTASQSDQDMVDFARCLRRHGVAEPDPFHRPGHVGLSIAIPQPGPTANSALAACDHLIVPIQQQKQAGARQELAAWLPALTRYAQCMRNHDIAMLDPDAEGSLNLGAVPGISSDFGRYSPQFRAADGACRHLLPAAVHDDGTGP